MANSIDNSEILTVDEDYDNSNSNTFDPDKTPEEIKLKPMRITRVNTELLLKENCNNEVKNKFDLKLAYKIIDDIIGKKRKRAEESSGRLEKKQRTAVDNSDSDLQLEDSSTSNEYKLEFLPLEFDPEMQHLLMESGVPFTVKLYVTSTKGESRMTKSMSCILSQNSREILLEEKEVKKSYILFFCRNIESPMNKGSFIPEIFAITSGCTWKIFSDPEKGYADKTFPKMVERKTLQFPFDHVEFEKESGKVTKVTQSARPGHKIIFSVWDFMDKLVGNRKRQLRENSSLYSESLNNAFLTKTGKKIPSKIEVSNTALKIMRDLNLVQLGLVLNHFSDVFLDTDKAEKNEKEEKGEDEEMFEMQEFIAEVSDENVKTKLNESLHHLLKKSMEGIKSNIYLTHKSLHEWQTADNITLLAKTSKKEETKRRKRKCLNSESPWREPPSLEDIMKLLHDKCDREYQTGWLDNEDALIKFKEKGSGETLKNFLFTRISAEPSGVYIYHYGTWMEMNAQYLYIIEKDFVDLLRKKIIKRSKLSWLLPWKNLPEKKKEKSKENNQESASKEKQNKVVDYDIEKSKPKWQHHFRNVCKREEPFEQVYTEAEKLKGRKAFTSKYDSLMEKSLDEIAGNLYHHLECRLEEDEYNKAHSLLNKICNNSHEVTIITGDKKTPHYIELCDILMFRGNTTYLVHVKKDFELGSIRAVCSQIRNSADHIYREQTGGTGIIQRYWEMLNKSKRSESITLERFQGLFSWKRTIVFVLACRDTRKGCDFIDDVPKKSSLKVNVTDTIREKFKNEYGEIIIAKLKEAGYLTQKEKLTNQFILDGNSIEGSGKFLENILSYKVLKDKNDAQVLHKVLVSGLSKSNSTGAKMEIIRLAQYFEKIGKKNFKFRIYSICHDFHSFDGNAIDDPDSEVDESSDDEEEIDTEHATQIPSTSGSQQSDKPNKPKKRGKKSVQHNTLDNYFTVKKSKETGNSEK